MRKAEDVCMEHSPEASPPGTLTQSDQKKASNCTLQLKHLNSPYIPIGWTPSTFVSSRSDRAKTKTARPEDFMDEEDLAELRDSQKLVDTNEEMDIPTGQSKPGESE